MLTYNHVWLLQIRDSAVEYISTLKFVCSGHGGSVVYEYIIYVYIINTYDTLKVCLCVCTELTVNLGLDRIAKYN